MKINSKSKGKRGELEFANWLKKKGFQAKRGQQYKGGEDSPDVICPKLKGYHIEVKRCESLSLYRAMEQAAQDSGKKIPIVAHRRNRKEWLIVLKADDFLGKLGEKK